MGTHPYREVVIAAVHNTQQARQLPGHTSLSIAIEAAIGVIDAAGIDPLEIDGVLGQFNVDLTYLLGLMPAWAPTGGMGGIPEVLAAADAIAVGHCGAVLIAGGGAGVYTDRSATAPWTRVTSEFVLPFGIYTALEFALIARRHMYMYGTTPEQMARVAAIIRNNGHVNPEAIYYGRGPFTAEDVLASRMVADPFHLLDCSLTGEGGCALLMTTAERAKDLRCTPVYILGGGIDHNGPSYQHPPSWDLRGNRPDAIENGYVGQRAAERAFAMAGLKPPDVDVAELYDPFSFEIIRQLEAFGFCKRGEGGEYATSGALEPSGELPITTDGGLMSFSHGGGSVQLLQRVIRGVQQLKGSCATMQVPDAEVAMASNGGAGALFNDVILLGSEQP
ncbi:thiolase family protein [Mycobacterium sp. NPDC051804]|uniref:thiolase family protein n=1 Tax=Mycobacterium sp. NPDC051804 TaxID=3364295 RepID=UPI0037A854B6